MSGMKENSSVYRSIIETIEEQSVFFRSYRPLVVQFLIPYTFVIILGSED